MYLDYSTRTRYDVLLYDVHRTSYLYIYTLYKSKGITYVYVAQPTYIIYIYIQGTMYIVHMYYVPVCTMYIVQVQVRCTSTIYIVHRCTEYLDYSLVHSLVELLYDVYTPVFLYL